MTWSIIARDPATGHIGIAVATRFFAVGARVPHIAPGIGGVATQALVNPFYGIDGVKLLREGAAAARGVDTLIAADDGREHRQVHVMDAKAASPRIPDANASTGAGMARATASRLPATCWPARPSRATRRSAYAANAGLPFPATADRGA